MSVQACGKVYKSNGWVATAADLISGKVLISSDGDTLIVFRGGELQQFNASLDKWEAACIRKITSALHLTNERCASKRATDAAIWGSNNRGCVLHSVFDPGAHTIEYKFECGRWREKLASEHNWVLSSGPKDGCEYLPMHGEWE